MERSVEDCRSWEPPSSDNGPGMVTSVLQTQRTEFWKYKNALWSEFSQIPWAWLIYSFQSRDILYRETRPIMMQFWLTQVKGCCILLYELFLFLQIIILQACIFFPFSQVYIPAFSLEHVETYYFSSWSNYAISTVVYFSFYFATTSSVVMILVMALIYFNNFL